MASREHRNSQQARKLSLADTAAILALLSVSIAMAMALAHALEFPGKIRLSRTDYETVWEIYYPGFTYGGASEGTALLLMLILLLAGAWQGQVFWLTFAVWLTLMIIDGVYWILIHPINSFWLKNFRLRGFGARFFGFGGRKVTAHLP